MFSKQGELDLARVLKALIDAGDIEPRPGFRGAGLVDHGPKGVRQRVTIEPNIRRSTTTGTYFVEKHKKSDSFDTLTEARKFVKKIAKEKPSRLNVGRDISFELLREIKNSYLKGNSAFTISKNLLKRYPNKIGISSSTIDSVLTKLKTESVNKIPKFTKTELKNRPTILGINQFVSVALDPKKMEAIKKDAKTLTKSEIIKKHNVSIQSLLSLEEKGLIKFPIRGVGKPPFKPHVTDDAKTVLKILESEPKITTSGLEKKLGWSKLKIASATKALKNIISPKTGAVRTGIEIPSSLKKAILNLKDPVGSVEEDLLKAGIKKSDVDKITRGRVAVREFFPQGTNFEHHLPRNLFSYFKDKNIQYKLDITGSRTSPELNRFKLRYDRLMKGAVNEFLRSEATANDLKIYNKKITDIRDVVRKATNGYEMGYIKFDLNKNPKPVLFAKSIEEGTRALGPESAQKLNTFKNTKYTKALLRNYKNNPNNPIYSTLKNYASPHEITDDYINRYDKYAKEYEKIKPHLSSREKIISYAKKHLDSPVVKALFKSPYGKFGLALSGAAILPTALAADTGVEKAKSWPIEHPWLTGAGATGATAATKGGRKFLKRAITGVLGPTGIVGMTAGFGFDPKDPIDRMGAATEAAFAPELVKATIGATKGMKNRGAQKVVQQLLNLGLPTQTALRVARVAQPLGLLYLGGEGLYHMYKKGHFDKERMMPSLMDRTAYEEAQKEKFDKDEPMFAGGGLTRTVAPDSGPVSQGLRSLYIDDMD